MPFLHSPPFSLIHSLAGLKALTELATSPNLAIRSINVIFNEEEDAVFEVSTQEQYISWWSAFFASLKDSRPSLSLRVKWDSGPAEAADMRQQLCDALDRVRAEIPAEVTLDWW